MEPAARASGMKIEIDAFLKLWAFVNYVVWNICINQNSGQICAAAKGCDT
jgi:hypothetical protein